MGTWLCVFIPVHEAADLPHHGVEGFWLVSVDVMPRPPHVVDLDVGVRSQLLDSLSRAAVHPRPHSVDKCERNRGCQVWGSNAIDHRPFGPTNGDLHVVECSFTSGETKYHNIGHFVKNQVIHSPAIIVNHKYSGLND